MIVIKIWIVNLQWLEVFSQRNVYKEAGGQYVMYQFGKMFQGNFEHFGWRCKIFQHFPNQRNVILLYAEQRSLKLSIVMTVLILDGELSKTKVLFAEDYDNLIEYSIEA